MTIEFRTLNNTRVTLDEKYLTTHQVFDPQIPRYRATRESVRKALRLLKTNNYSQLRYSYKPHDGFWGRISYPAAVEMYRSYGMAIGCQVFGLVETDEIIKWANRRRRASRKSR